METDESVRVAVADPEVEGGRVVEVALDRAHAGGAEGGLVVLGREVGGQADVHAGIFGQMGLVVPVVGHGEGNAVGGQPPLHTENGIVGQVAAAIDIKWDNP